MVTSFLSEADGVTEAWNALCTELELSAAVKETGWGHLQRLPSSDKLDTSSAAQVGARLVRALPRYLDARLARVFAPCRAPLRNGCAETVAGC